ncbi:transient receptor potential cation channel subfamily M member 5-like, partial [Herpailurus yagouaroundi]|uniref:transient receptor potential cation channel subfamily M member 5-like n=1 Tax=Herpailurus yagouaroundi TaxID=1608482 RepID=UPI001AD62C52
MGTWIPEPCPGLVPNGPRPHPDTGPQAWVTPASGLCSPPRVCPRQGLAAPRPWFCPEDPLAAPPPPPRPWAPGAGSPALPPSGGGDRPGQKNPHLGLTVGGGGVQEDSPVHYPVDEGSSRGPLCSLDNNHTYFILVEPGPPGKGDGPSELRLRLEKHIAEQRTGYGGTSSIEIPVLCLLVNGDPSTLERISRAVEHAAPWLILAGSGGIADVLAAFVNQPHLLVPQAVEKQFKEKFPGERLCWEDVVHWTQLLQNITSHPHLLTVHDFEQEGSEELDTIILKALIKACKSHSQEAQDYLDELKLAVAWDRVDIAKSEIFNGDVEWKSRDLEEVMMDALVSDKPEFVRLFVDNGADVADFLTFGRLQQLYRSTPPKSLLFDLLRRKHEEGRLTLAGLGAQQARELPEGPPAFSLHEVSRLLKDFLHDACRGLYQAERSPAGRPEAGKGLLDLNRKSENPWRDLFLWAVLQNRHEMAAYFWAMGQEGVAAALAACKILREMSHLEAGAEGGHGGSEAKYEQLALGLFSECYRSSEDRAFALLVRRNRCWSRTTCLHLATEADTKAFFAHDGVQVRVWLRGRPSGAKRTADGRCPGSPPPPLS